MRNLTSGLTDRGLAVTWNGHAAGHGDEQGKIWGTRVSRLLPLMTRKSLQFFAVWYSQMLGRKWAAEALKSCDVVHFVGTGWNLMGFSLLNAARCQGKIMTCWPAVHPGTWGDSSIDVNFYGRLNYVFVQSDFEKEHLARLGVPRERFVRCGCAPSISKPGDGLRFRQTHALQEKRIILFVGRKSEEKGYPALRSAISKLVKTRSDVVLVSIGKDVSPPYPELTREQDLDLGIAEENTKQDALSACDIFVLPSNAESFGIVYVEAWANGKPVICGSAPASRELVERHTGGLVSDGSTCDIARAIQTLLGNKELANQMGKNGHQAVLNHYTADVVVETHLQAWNIQVS